MSGAVAAILLAAGKSSRMGSCKQLLPLGNCTVLDRCLDTLIAAGIAEIVVVVSAADTEVAQAAQRHPVRIAINPDPDGDMASSVLTGRDALPATISGVIVAPGDYPLVLSATIIHLMQAHTKHPERIIIPCHSGQRGHPLLFPRTVLDKLAAGMILRDLVQSAPDRVLLREVTDPGILQDMDTPEDFQKIRELIAA